VRTRRQVFVVLGKGKPRLRFTILALVEVLIKSHRIVAKFIGTEYCVANLYQQLYCAAGSPRQDPSFPAVAAWQF